MKSLTQEEILKVLKIASEDRRNLAMILLGFKHGMRASEVCGLELKDLDLKNGEITIRRLKGSLKTTQPIADIQGQPLLSEKRVLRAWLDERGNHPSRFVFVSQKSGRVHRSQLHRVFADIAERAGLPKDKRHFHCLKHSLGVSLVEANVNQGVFKTLNEEAEKKDEKPVRPFVLYDLRHTFLTRLGESGCDVWTLARIAGHCNIKQSSRYVHPSDDAVLGAMERMGGKSGGHKIGYNAKNANRPTRTHRQLTQ